MIQIREILVPTDFSESAVAALAYAKGLAAQFKSRLHLLHVVAIPQLGWAGDASTYSWSTLLADLEADARAELERQLPKSDPSTAGATVATAIGVPVEQILEYATANHIDLIVMGTHGRGLVGHMLLGSVAERVVRRAPVPVLTVHGAIPRPEEQPDRRVHAEVPLTTVVL
jgi:universal stress protein A